MLFLCSHTVDTWPHHLAAIYLFQLMRQTFERNTFTEMNNIRQTRMTQVTTTAADEWIFHAYPTKSHWCALKYCGWCCEHWARMMMKMKKMSARWKYHNIRAILVSYFLECDTELSPYCCVVGRAPCHCGTNVTNIYGSTGILHRNPDGGRLSASVNYMVRLNYVHQCFCVTRKRFQDLDSSGIMRSILGPWLLLKHWHWHRTHARAGGSWHKQPPTTTTQTHTNVGWPPGECGTVKLNKWTNSRNEWLNETAWMSVAVESASTTKLRDNNQKSGDAN